MPAVGELVRDGKWMIRPPQHSPRGHRPASWPRAGRSQGVFVRWAYVLGL
ncbi:hypothetical protein I552_1046 [Mycobacterium xenopi 3993]|nr:hypothetical protein I552_1046 [Mycobacterium xenopi 3993]